MSREINALSSADWAEFSSHLPGSKDAWHWFVTWKYDTPEEKWGRYEMSMASLQALIERGEE